MKTCSQCKHSSNVGDAQRNHSNPTKPREEYTYASQMHKYHWRRSEQDLVIVIFKVELESRE